MEIGPPKYKQGDYVRACFGGGHVKCVINGVKRNKRVDAALRDGSMSPWFLRHNPNGWYYQVAKHYGTGTKDIPDLSKAHWSDNLKLVISEGEIIKAIPADSDFKIRHLTTGMTDETEQLIRSNR